jgi:hypothetical protein
MSGWDRSYYGCSVCQTVTGKWEGWESEFSLKYEMEKKEGQCDGSCPQCGAPVTFIPQGRWPNAGRT